MQLSGNFMAFIKIEHTSNYELLCKYDLCITVLVCQMLFRLLLADFTSSL